MSIVTRAGKGSALTHTEMDTNLGYLVPAGFVMAFAHATIPSGWLECNGAAISRTTYADLFSTIGTYYGTGDGSSTFNIPDLRGQFIRGWDHGAGNDPDAASRTNRGDSTTGDNVGTKQTDEKKEHRHKLSRTTPAGSEDGSVLLDDNTPFLKTTGRGGTSNVNYEYALAGLTEITGNEPDKGLSGKDGGNETRPKNIQMPWCIKT